MLCSECIQSERHSYLAFNLGCQFLAFCLFHICLRVLILPDHLYIAHEDGQEQTIFVHVQIPP